MKQSTALMLLAVGLVLLLSARNGDATLPNCWHWHKPKPPVKLGTASALPFEDCKTDADCCGNQECRTYSAFPNFGDHAPYPDMHVVGHKRCVPKSFKHATPTAEEMYLAPTTPTEPNGSVSIAALTAKYPEWPDFEAWKCSEGVYSDWYVPHFCCIDDWMTDLFPPCGTEGTDKYFCWNNDVVKPSLQACRKYSPYPGFINKKDACCWEPAAKGGASAQDRYADATTGSRCLIGIVTQAPGPGSDESVYGVTKECCPNTCNYMNPTEDSLWMCVKASDLGWAVVGDNWVRVNANACDLHAVRDMKVAGKLVKNQKMFDCAAAK